MRTIYPFSFIGWLLMKISHNRYELNYETAIKAASNIPFEGMRNKAIRWIAGEFLWNVRTDYVERFVLGMNGPSATCLYEVMRNHAIKWGWLSSAKLYSLKLDQPLTDGELRKIFIEKMRTMTAQDIDDPIFGGRDSLPVSTDEMRDCVKQHLDRGDLQSVTSFLKPLHLSLEDFGFSKKQQQVFLLAAR